MKEYVRELSREEIRDSFILVERKSLPFFPPAGKIFNLCLKELCLIVKIDSLPGRAAGRLRVPNLSKYFKTGEKARIVKKGAEYELLKG